MYKEVFGRLWKQQCIAQKYHYLIMNETFFTFGDLSVKYKRFEQAHMTEQY